MKDYYYFLGINQDASSEDIKKAYRKLSKKYHPDKNLDDEFFKLRFRETQEAYEALIDVEHRKIYDEQFQSIDRKVKSSLPPKIQKFHSDKIRARVGDEIRLYWQTYDADLVKILPFGLQKTNGEKRFKITQFDNKGQFQMLLHATNSNLQKTVVQALIITKLEEGEEVEKSPRKQRLENPQNRQQQRDGDEISRQSLFRVITIVLIVLAAILLVKAFL